MGAKGAGPLVEGEGAVVRAAEAMAEAMAEATVAVATEVVQAAQQEEVVLPAAVKGEWKEALVVAAMVEAREGVGSEVERVQVEGVKAAATVAVGS